MNSLKSTRLVVLGLVVGSFMFPTSCSKPNSASDLDGFDSLVTSSKESEPFFERYSDNPEFPAFPRHEVSRDIGTLSAVTATVGIKTGFMGAEFKALTQVSFQKQYKVSVFLVAPGNERIFADKEMTYFNNGPTHRIVRMCRVSASFSLDNSLIGSIDVGGNGIEGQKEFRDATEVVQASGLEFVPNGDSWPNQIEACMAYAKANQESVDADLMKATESMVYHNAQNECVTDEQCKPWHSTLFSVVAAKTKPICELQKNNARFCRVRGIEGNACSVYDPKTKERLTSGGYEYPCADGFECQVTKKGGWFQNWEIYEYTEAECQAKKTDLTKASK